MEAASLEYHDWLRGWRSWASNRKRGKLAQFIVDLLETNNGAKWVDVTKGKFELTEWHSIAQKWYKQKARASQTQDAPCMLRKGLPRAFPNLLEVKDESLKDGTQYRSRMFQCPPELVREVVMCALGQPLPSTDDPYTDIKDDPDGDLDDCDVPYGYDQYAQVPVGHVLPQVMNNMYQTNYGTAYYARAYEPPVVSQGNSGWDNHAHSPLANSESINGASPSHVHHHHYNPSPTAPHMGSSSDFIDASPQSHFSDSPYGMANPSGGTQQPALPSVQVFAPPHNTSNMATAPIGVQDAGAQSLTRTAGMLLPTSSGILALVKPFGALLTMKALPSRSPVEGGSEVALIFREHLPNGLKFVKFVTQDGLGEQVVETREENGSTLSAIIPGHHKPEIVYLQVLCNGQIVAITEFEYYQTVDTDLQQFYQLLNSNLPGFFPTMGGMGGYGMLPQGGQGGGGMSGTPGYGYHGGNTLHTAYLLLIGACKWGVNSIVKALLQLPRAEGLVSMVTPDGRLPEDIARANDHNELADHLKCLRMMVVETSSPQVTARGPSQQDEAKVERERKQKRIFEQLDGEEAGSPQARVTSVLQALKRVAERCDVASTVKEVLEVKPRGTSSKEDESGEQLPWQSSETSLEEITEMMEALRMDKRDLQRKLEKSERERRHFESKSTALQCELDEAQEESSGLAQRLRESDRRQRTASPSFVRRGPLQRDQSILSDHGICVSFDEEVSKRRSSSLLCTGQYTLLSDQQQRSITIKLPPEMNVADSLIYETTHLITEDYPPGNGQDVLLRYGDRIVEINGQYVHGLNAYQIDELLRKDDSVTLTVTPRTKAA